jgi:hypothetical protein
LATKKSQWEKPRFDETEDLMNRTQNTNKSIEQEQQNFYENNLNEQEVNYVNRAKEHPNHHNHHQNHHTNNDQVKEDETLEPIYVDGADYQESDDLDEDGFLNDEPIQIKCSHIIVKHRHSRKPYSWRDDKIMRTPKEALAIIKCNLLYSSDQKFRYELNFVQLDYRKEIMRAKKPKKKLETIAYQYSDCPTASKGKNKYKIK